MPIAVLFVKHSKRSAAIDGHSWYISLGHTISPLKEQNLVAWSLPASDPRSILNRNTIFQLHRQVKTNEKYIKGLKFGVKLPPNSAEASSLVLWLSSV